MVGDGQRQGYQNVVATFDNIEERDQHSCYATQDDHTRHVQVKYEIAKSEVQEISMFSFEGNF